MIHVEHDRHRLVGNTELVPDLGRVGHRIGHIEPLYVTLAVLDGVVVGHADENHLSFELLSQLVEMGLLPLTLKSPRFPEIQDDRGSPLLGEREGVTLERLNLEVGSVRLAADVFTGARSVGRWRFPSGLFLWGVCGGA